jgi:hypothetical protein
MPVQRIPITERQYRFVWHLITLHKAEVEKADALGRRIADTVNPILMGHTPVVQGYFDGIEDGEDGTFSVLVEVPETEGD